MLYLISFQLSCQELKFESYGKNYQSFHQTLGTFLRDSSFAIFTSSGDPHELRIALVNAKGEIHSSHSITSDSTELYPNEILTNQNGLTILFTEEGNSQQGRVHVHTYNNDLELLSRNVVSSFDGSSAAFVNSAVFNDSGQLFTLVNFGKFYIIKFDGSGSMLDSAKIKGFLGHNLQINPQNGNLTAFVTNLRNDSVVICYECLVEYDQSLWRVHHLKANTTKLNYDNGNESVFHDFDLNSFPSLITSGDDKFIVSSFVADTSRLPGGVRRSNYFLRVAQFKNDTLFNEISIKDEEYWLRTAYFNSVKLPDSSFLVFGIVNASENYMPLSPIDSKFVLCKFDSKGNLIWRKEYGEEGQYYHASEIVASADGRIALVGFTYEYNNSGFAYPYALILDYNGNPLDTLSRSEIVRNDNGLKLYPNPANNFIEVSGQQETGIEIELKDAQGRSVMDHIIQPRDRIDIRYFKSGLYFYTLKLGERQVSGKLVIQH